MNVITAVISASSALVMIVLNIVQNSNLLNVLSYPNNLTYALTADTKMDVRRITLITVLTSLRMPQMYGFIDPGSIHIPPLKSEPEYAIS